MLDPILIMLELLLLKMLMVWPTKSHGVIMSSNASHLAEGSAENILSSRMCYTHA